MYNIIKNHHPYYTGEKKKCNMIDEVVLRRLKQNCVPRSAITIGSFHFNILWNTWNTLIDNKRLLDGGSVDGERESV